MRYTLLIVFIVTSVVVKGQFLDTFKVFLHSKPNIHARLESRNSFIKYGRAKISGVRLGLSFKRKLRVGIGYSWLDADVSDPIKITDAFGKPIIVDNHLKFGYACYYADFVFHKTKRWQLSIPIQVGTGMYWFQYSNGLQTIKSQKRLLLLYEPGISVQFKIFRWCGLGADIGYRFTLKNNKYIGEKLNSPTYAFKLLFWFDQLFFMAAPKHKLTKKFGPAYW